MRLIWYGWFYFFLFLAVECFIAPTQVLAQYSVSNSGELSEAEDPRVTKLWEKLLDTDPSKFDERLDLCRQILRLQPDHRGALQMIGPIEAGSAANKKKKEDEAESNSKKEKEEASGKKLEKDFRQAMVRGDLSQASQILDMMGRVAPNYGPLQGLQKVLSGAIATKSRLDYLMFGGIAGIVGALVLILVWKRKPKHAFLVYRNGRFAGQEREVPQGITRMGSIEVSGDRVNDVVFSEGASTVSRFHCELQYENNRLSVTDLDSSNGTYLNGRRIRPKIKVPIQSNARLGLGSSIDISIVFRRLKK